MSTNSKTKLEREQLNQIVPILRSNGVRRYQLKRTMEGHMEVKFEHGGRKHILRFSGSGDWRAPRRTVSILRGMIEGRR